MSEVSAARVGGLGVDRFLGGSASVADGEAERGRKCFSCGLVGSSFAVGAAGGRCWLRSDRRWLRHRCCCWQCWGGLLWFHLWRDVDQRQSARLFFGLHPCVCCLSRAQAQAACCQAGSKSLKSMTGDGTCYARGANSVNIIDIFARQFAPFVICQLIFQNAALSFQE